MKVNMKKWLAGQSDVCCMYANIIGEVTVISVV